MEEILKNFFRLPREKDEAYTEKTFKKMLNLSQSLKTYGPIVVEPILAMLYERKKSNLLTGHNLAMYFLIYTIKDFIDERHIERLIQILFWDEVLKTRDRDLRSNIIQILERIGGPAAIQALKRLSDEIKKTKYRSIKVDVSHPLIKEKVWRTSIKELKEFDQDEIRRALQKLEK